MVSDSADFVRIFDTTLRDGEQSPGATMTSAEKLEVARALSRLGVDVIEAGFPAASPDDLAAVRTIAERVGSQLVEGRPSHVPPTICGLARASKGDIDKAWEAVKWASKPRIHTFLATSDIHMEHKLRMSRKDVLARTAEMVAYARSLCEDIEFSPEDAGRSDPQFLYEVLDVAIRAGATTLNIPDTVGYTVPDEFGQLIAGIRKNVPGIEKAIISVHCHDDLGLAVANTLAGLRNGARQAEVTINGIGERAGNTALEELVMILRTRASILGLRTGIDTTQLTRASKLVSTATGINVQPNKAVVGANAFAHESGIHQDGMLKNQETYEIMRPEVVGAAQTRLVLGKHSGRHALAMRLAELGYPLQGVELDKAFERFKAFADRRKYVTDADLEAMLADDTFHIVEYYTLDGLLAGSGTMGMPTATVRLRGPDGRVHTCAAVGTGPVDAAYKAIDQIIKAQATLLEFSVHSVTEGIDALGEVSVRVRANTSKAPLNPQRGEVQSRVFHGHGADTDIILASVKAYLKAINRLLASEGIPAQSGPTEDGLVRNDDASHRLQSVVVS
jgi:2-isopropylmalate synthase